MKKILGPSSVILLFAIILITVISGCGSESNSNNTDKKIKVTIPFDLSAKALQKSNQIDNSNNFYGPAPSNIRSIRVDAVYRDGRKIPSTIDVAGGTYVEVNMEVDAGDYVFFNAFAYDGTGGTGNLLYLGASSPQPLLMGMYYDIIIQMSAYSATSPTITSVTPANGSTGVPTSSILTVIFSTQMDHSTINDSTVTTSPHIGCYGSGGSGTTATCTPSPALSPNTTYTITFTTGVKNLAGNAMASSYTWSFTTGADGGGGGGGGGTSLPSVFSYSLPLNGATGVSLTPTLSWADSIGETSYTIEIATATGIVHSATVGADIINYTVSTGLSPLTTYYWKVKAVNSYGATLVSNAPFTFTTTSGGGGGGGSIPTSFSLGAPLNNSTGVSTTPTLSWTDSTGETGYAIEIATNSSFTPTVYSATVVADVISHTVSTSLSSLTTYYWRVKAINSYGNTLASNAPFTFTTGGGGGGSAPTAFNFSLPLNGATGVSTTPTLSWTDSIGETSYAIEIATNSSFTPTVYSATVVADVISHTVSTSLSSLTTYYWRVKAINSYGATIVSNAPFTFTTQ